MDYNQFGASINYGSKRLSDRVDTFCRDEVLERTDLADGGDRPLRPKSTGADLDIVSIGGVSEPLSQMPPGVDL